MENTTGTTTDLDTWVEQGTTSRQADIAGDGGSYCVRLAEDAGVYQTVPFTQTNKGRYIDQLEPLFLTCYAANATGGGSAVLAAQVFILDASDNLKYYYNWVTGKYVAMTSSQTMADGKAHGFVLGASESSGVLKKLPRIEAPAAAGGDVSDTYKLRVRFTNATGSAISVDLDGVILSVWAEPRIARLGRFAVCYNGHNYPVKYDTKTQTITELSLNYPYQHGDFPIPSSSGTTGGSLANSQFFGVAYTFVNEDVGEESAAPRGTALSSGYFTVATGASDTQVDIDFSALELPNLEVSRETDTTEVTHIRVYRTTGRSTQAAAAQAAAEEAGALIYEGQVAVNGTFSMTLSDTDLLEQASKTIPFDPSRAPMPLFRHAAVHRNRLWVASGRTYRMGEVTVTQSDEAISGTEQVAGFANGSTNWNRGVEWGTALVTGDTETYTVERYAYPGDSGTTTLPERLYLTRTYDGSSGGNKTISIRPVRGRVWFSEEGRPYHTTWQSFFFLDGDDGEDITGLVSAQSALLAFTRKSTFVYNYNQTPAESQYAYPISRDLGCIAPESAVEIRGIAYWLSAEGVCRSDGTRVEVMSNDLQDMFTDPDDPDYIVRQSWSQMATACKGAHYAPGQQYLLAVRTKNAKQGCDVVLVYNYFFECWDIFRLTTGLMRWAEVVDRDGNTVLGFVDDFGQFCRWDVGHVDGAGEVNNHGALTGTTSASTNLSLTPGYTANLYSSSLSNNFSSATLGLEGAWLKIVAGKGQGQIRRVERVLNGAFVLNEDWETLPNTTSVWELGGIDFTWNFKRTNLGLPGRPKTVRFLNVDQKAQGLASEAEVRYFADSSDADVLSATDEAAATFPTGLTKRAKAAGKEATGYALKVQIRCDGPEAPLEIWNLSAPMLIKQEDK